MNIKENIINRLRETNRENIENVIAYMEGNGFFDRGCHRHHRYYMKRMPLLPQETSGQKYKILDLFSFFYNSFRCL